MINREELLGSIPMFEGLDQQDTVELAAALEERFVPSGQVLFEVGDAGRTMFIVVSGLVNIYLPGDLSTRVSLANLSVGKVFGEVA
ncbi:MAG: cyclic nucleotide-binding domain-containing protein, partial [Polyangiaceae bacterium]|nr:cyclic nucleotide-binding domain-containing protein [Polyangiaceae bacterium]